MELNVYSGREIEDLTHFELFTLLFTLDCYKKLLEINYSKKMKNNHF